MNKPRFFEFLTGISPQGVIRFDIVAELHGDSYPRPAVALLFGATRHPLIKAQVHREDTHEWAGAWERMQREAAKFRRWLREWCQTELQRMHARYALGFKVGDPVIVVRDDGRREETTIACRPWQLGHGAWVVGLTGITGGFALGRVLRPADAPRAGDQCAGCGLPHVVCQCPLIVPEPEHPHDPR